VIIPRVAAVFPTKSKGCHNSTFYIRHFLPGWTNDGKLNIAEHAATSK